MRFKDALSGPGLAAIAEFKRRSPSMGDIRPDARVEDVIRTYSDNGASAISVLVDERFAGTIDDLVAARAATSAPLLAKGFFSTEERLYIADCVALSARYGKVVSWQEANDGCNLWLEVGLDRVAPAAREQEDRHHDDRDHDGPNRRYAPRNAH